MSDYSLVHLSDAVLLRELAQLAVQDRVITVALLAHIAEVDNRRLYVPAGYPSMFAYCVDELRLSEDAAYKRIQAARAARQFSGLFYALADGRLHLAALCLLAPHLTTENADDLIQLATHRSKSQIEALLAGRYPLAESPRGTQVLPATPQLAPGQVGVMPSGVDMKEELRALGQVEKWRSVASPSERLLLQLTISESTYAKIRYAQDLLSHAVPSGDMANVLDRALDTLIRDLEKRKFGAKASRKSQPRARTSSRYVPAHVRRGVWERDQGRCTFVSSSGRRCATRKFLEFDHVEPVARGGEASVVGMRLRCRAHNQYEAERVFGADFMSRKRHEARQSRAESRSVAMERVSEVLAGLRGLGCRAQEAHRAAEFSETLHGSPLEERMRAALQFLSRGSIPQKAGDLRNPDVAARKPNGPRRIDQSPS
jgi:hypothetical protein